MLIGLLMKIPYVKQIGIGMLVMIMLYMWYLTHHNNSLIIKNEQYKIELRGWEASYNSLIAEAKASEELLRKRRRFLTRLTKEKQTLKMIVNQAQKENVDVKVWFNTPYPDDILRLRKRLRIQRSQRAKEP